MKMCNISCVQVGLHSVFIPETLRFVASNVRLDSEIVQILAALPDQAQLVCALERCRSPDEFIASLEEIVNSSTLLAPSSSGTSVSKIRASHCAEAKLLNLLVLELNTIGWEKVLEINDSLDFIKFAVADSKGQQHVFDVSFGKNFPTDAPVVNANIPKKFALSWPFPNNSNPLVTLYDFVRSEILRFEEYFEVQYIIYIIIIYLFGRILIFSCRF